MWARKRRRLRVDDLVSRAALFLLALAVVAVVPTAGSRFRVLRWWRSCVLGAFAAWCATLDRLGLGQGHRLGRGESHCPATSSSTRFSSRSLGGASRSLSARAASRSPSSPSASSISLAPSGDPSAYFHEGSLLRPCRLPERRLRVVPARLLAAGVRGGPARAPGLVRGEPPRPPRLPSSSSRSSARAAAPSSPSRLRSSAYLLIVPRPAAGGHRPRLRGSDGAVGSDAAARRLRADPRRPGLEGRGPSRAGGDRHQLRRGVRVWSLVSLLDRRVDLGARTVRIANLAGLALAGAALVAGLVFVATSRDRIDRSWHNFKAGYPTQTTSSHFSLGVGSNRYDFWRVAVLEFRHHPLQGVGVDNFARGLHPRTTERGGAPLPAQPRAPACSGKPD